MRALPPMPWMNTTGGAEEFAGDALFMAAPSAALGAGAPGPYRRMMLAATCRDNWPRGPVRCLSGGLALERRVAIGLQAAFLEFLPAAARARVVAPDVLERIDGLALIQGPPDFCVSFLSALFAFQVSLAKAIPSRHFVNSIAEQRILVRTLERCVRAFNRGPQVFEKMPVFEQGWMNPLLVTCLLDQRLHFLKPKGCNSSFPPVPDETARFILKFGETGVEKFLHLLAREFSPYCDHREHFQH